MFVDEVRKPVPPPRGYRSVSVGGCPNMTTAFVSRRRGYLEAACARGRIPRVEIGSVDMTCLLGSGVQRYRPTLGATAIPMGDGRIIRVGLNVTTPIAEGEPNE